jgi:hypothetical protein
MGKGSQAYTSQYHIQEITNMNNATLELVAVAVVGIALAVAATIGAYMWAVTLF